MEKQPEMEMKNPLIPCKYLRNKEMYHQSDGLAEDGFDSGTCWCTKTQESFGPDGEAADARECGPGRGCYSL